MPATNSSDLLSGLRACAEVGGAYELLEGDEHSAHAFAAAEALKALTPPEGREYGVCVGGACETEADEGYPSIVEAVARAEEIKARLVAEGYDDPVQILLW